MWAAAPTPFSWRSARCKDLTDGQWLRTRLRRLGIPLIPLLLAWLVIGADARALLPELLTGLWWATRPLWALALVVLTGLVVLVMGRFETPRADGRPAPATWKPMLAAVTVIAGLAVMASVGVVGESGAAWWWPLLPVAGTWGFGVVDVKRGLRAPSATFE